VIKLKNILSEKVQIRTVGYQRPLESVNEGKLK